MASSLMTGFACTLNNSKNKSAARETAAAEWTGRCGCRRARRNRSSHAWPALAKARNPLGQNAVADAGLDLHRLQLGIVAFARQHINGMGNRALPATTPAAAPPPRTPA